MSTDGNEAAIAAVLRARLRDGPIDLPVSGSSMRCVIESGSRVEIIAADSPRRGEVWAFVAAGETVVVHRIRDIENGRLIGRGSGNPVDDEPVPVSWAVGRVRSVVEPGGRRRGFGRTDRVRADVWFRIRRRIRSIVGRR